MTLSTTSIHSPLTRMDIKASSPVERTSVNNVEAQSAPLAEQPTEMSRIGFKRRISPQVALGKSLLEIEKR